jgi:hypothetical protein
MIMSAETRKVLEMLQAGQINPAQAEKLLEKLNGGTSAGSESRTGDDSSPSPAQKLRYLRVLVENPQNKQVNVRIPLAFLRSGTTLLAVLPPRVNERLAEKGVDLSALAELKGERLEQALRDLHVNIDSPEGNKVQVFCE